MRDVTQPESGNGTDDPVGKSLDKQGKNQLDARPADEIAIVESAIDMALDKLLDEISRVVAAEPDDEQAETPNERVLSKPMAAILKLLSDQEGS